MKKKSRLRSPKEEALAKARTERVLPYAWKPGQSGNPGGRPKKLTRLLEEYLDKKVAKNKTYAQALIEAAVKRAIQKSDVMVKEIFERVEGHVPNNPAEAAQYGIKVVVLDMPRPPKFKQNEVIDVSGNGHNKNGNKKEEE